jgi:hypothetical protein
MGPDKIFMDCNRKARKPCEILDCGRNAVRWRKRKVDILKEMRLDGVREFQLGRRKDMMLHRREMLLDGGREI